MGTLLTLDQQAAVRRLYDDGLLHSPEIAARVGASTYQVRSYIRQIGLPSSRRKRLPDAEIRRRYIAGETLEQIAATLGVSSGTVRLRILDAGIPLREPASWMQGPKPHLQKVSDEAIRSLADGTRSCQEIATAVGLTDEVVRRRMIRMGLPRLAPKARPERNNFYRTGMTIDKDGYVLVLSPEHPHRTKGGYVREHRLVMEKVLGRYLLPEEVVDHIDGDPQNNSPENLRVFASNAEHLKATLSERPKGSRNPRSKRRAASTHPE